MANTIHPGFSSISRPEPNQRVSGSRPSGQAAAAEPVADSKEVSQDAELYGVLIGLVRAIDPPGDSDKTASISSQIEQGTYHPNPEQVAAAVAKGIK